MAPRVTAQPLSRIVAGDPTLADWQQRRARDDMLLTVLRRGVPRALAADLAVADTQNLELTLAAPNGAVAAVLRQRVPDLLVRLAREGLEFTAIKVTVQPRTTPAVMRKTVTLHMDSAAVPALSALRDSLPAGPLKAAIARIVAKHR